jgi:hypothetical protein
MPPKSFNSKQERWINAIEKNIFYYTVKNDGVKPTIIFMSEPLYTLLGGTNADRSKSKFEGIKILVFDDESYSYYFVDERQKGREP